MRRRPGCLAPRVHARNVQVALGRVGGGRQREAHDARLDADVEADLVRVRGRARARVRLGLGPGPGLANPNPNPRT